MLDAHDPVDVAATVELVDDELDRMNRMSPTCCISEADRTRIFERFARGTSTGPRSDGAGLGLAIIRAIAVAHGGQVLLDSVVGRGATFTVAVPAVLPEERRP